MDLYKQIYLRKSCRKYQMEPLSATVLQEIEDFIREMRPLLPEVAISHRLVGQKEIKGFMPLVPKAPHYLALSGKAQPFRDLCAGFLFQQLDLYLSARGIGCCWLGAAKGREGGEEEILTLCFGTPAEPVTRTEAEFKRKSLAEIASGEDSRLSAVRLAPSGLNAQPWHFAAQAGAVHVYRAVPGKLKAMLYSFQELDVGIALCHLMLASEIEGKAFQFVTAHAEAPSAPQGFAYVGTVV